LAMFLAVFIRLKDTLGNEVSAIRFLTTKAFLIVSILATTILLIILNGFTFWAAIVFTMALILLSSFTKIIDVTKKASIVITVFTALSVILLVFNTSKPNFDFSKIFKVSQLPAEVSLTRGASWEIAKQGLKDSPIFGTGPATFYYDFDKYKGTGINNTELWNVKFDNSTGILFSLLSTVGVLGTLAVGALLFISLFFVFGTVKRLKEEEDQLFIFPLFIGFATAIFFSIFVGFNSALTIYSVLIGVLTMAVSVSAKGDDSQILNLEPGTSKSIAIFSSIAFTLLLFLGVTMTMADVYAKQSVLVGGVPGKISMLEKAIGLAPYQDSYYVALSNHYIALANGSLGKEDVAATGVTLAKGH
ncbi:MAG: hypothetical protein NT091_00775, partial [Candidatus Falkowbacteria bacterium]|nr:hypothetical protein [Candidatus Falkowbacteria bacterium]